MNLWWYESSIIFREIKRTLFLTNLKSIRSSACWSHSAKLALIPFILATKKDSIGTYIHVQASLEKSFKFSGLFLGKSSKSQQSSTESCFHKNPTGQERSFKCCSKSYWGDLSSQFIKQTNVLIFSDRKPLFWQEKIKDWQEKIKDKHSVSSLPHWISDP